MTTTALLAFLTLSAATSEPVATSAKFALFSDVRINLHHMLYHWAGSTGPNPARFTAIRERQRFGQLSDEEQLHWMAAVRFYQEQLIARDLLFDRELVSIRNALASGSTGNSTNTLVNETIATLEEVLPIYERYWWPSHDASNRQWVDAVIPALRQHESSISGRIAFAFSGTWPARPIRVDVAAYTHLLGAYATGEPHVTIVSTRDDYGMPHALEMLFHEASHAETLEGELRRAIARARGSRQPPRGDDLWHQIIFFSAGESTRLSVENHSAYAVAHAMYARIPEWARMKPVLDREWAPVIAGKAPADAALRRIVDTWLSPPQ